MKQCPKCKAQLEENANFCLYCMTSLDEKEELQKEKSKKLAPYIIVAILLILLIAGAVFAFLANGDDPADTIKKPDLSAGSSKEDISDNSSLVPDDGSSDIAGSSEKPAPSNSPTPSNPSSDKGSASQTSSSKPSNSSSASTSSATSSTTSSKPSASETPSSSSSSSKVEASSSNKEQSSGSSSSATTVVYTYRDAVAADDYSASPSITNNAVVITGVQTPSANGVYEIPETIGGKKVVAIMDRAFCGASIKDTVKTIIIPASVRTINAYAFYDCYNITDIYIKGESVGCPSIILPEKNKRNFNITIHASKTCSDRNFHTYKTLCNYWEVTFKEWNG